MENSSSPPSSFGNNLAYLVISRKSHCGLVLNRLFSYFASLAIKSTMTTRIPFLVKSCQTYQAFLRFTKCRLDIPRRWFHRESRAYLTLEGNGAIRQRLRSGFIWITATSGLLLYSQLNSSRTYLKTAKCRRMDDGQGAVRGLRMNSQAELELFAAIRSGDLHKVKGIISAKQVDLNCRHSLGWTPLHLAAIRGEFEIVQALLEAGASPDTIDEYSNAAQIAYESRLNFLSIFMTREAEFADFLSGNVSFLGSTALHYACLADSPETVRILMQFNANPNLKNEFGHTPYDYLKDSTDQGMLQLLADFKQYCSKYDDFVRQQKLEERRKFPLEERIRQVIIGQEGAITTVAATIRRKENGWTDSEHPLVFLFLGSSGIGKTELAKQVAAYLHGGDKASGKASKAKAKQATSATRGGFIRFDMSEYQEKHSCAKFIGSPPGYVSHEDGGQLTKALTECPNAVVLFDEVEKAHPDVLTVMLALFDEGRITDGKGKTVECKDAIFIMTSNLASDEIADYGLRLRREAEELARAHSTGKIINEKETEDLDKVVVSRFFKDRVIRPILKRHFKRDEFLGRINEIVYFLPFSRSELHKLVSRELQLWSARAAQQHNISLTWDCQVIGVLANAYDVHYGARSIKYEVERRVVNKLAAAHENRLMLPGAKVKVVVSEDGEEFTFAKVEQSVASIEGSSASEVDSGSSESGDQQEDVEANANNQLINFKLKLLIENPAGGSGGGFFNKFGFQ